MQSKAYFTILIVAAFCVTCRKSSDKHPLVGHWKLTQVYSITATPAGWYDLPDTDPDNNYIYFGADGVYGINETREYRYQITSDSSFNLIVKLPSAEDVVVPKVYYRNGNELTVYDVPPLPPEIVATKYIRLN